MMTPPTLPPCSRYYIQRLFGICQDHYDYKNVNDYLTIPTKGFAKKAACYPEILTREDFDSFTLAFLPDEKVHIVMLIAEARRQAALLYGLRAIMRHMSGLGGGPRSGSSGGRAE